MDGNFSFCELCEGRHDTDDCPEYSSVPIPGMTKIPYGMPLLADAFIACGIAATTLPGSVESFAKETGIDLPRFVNRTHFEKMVDQATGAGKSVAAAWFDWVAVNVWGLEGDDSMHEEFDV